ncbi:MAG: hypothetical protein C0179_01340 [Fervidicoccus sp.]|nr:MAG: hypothetical protein C0179_01340 [Fervidicoccus sp.]
MSLPPPPGEIGGEIRDKRQELLYRYENHLITPVLIDLDRLIHKLLGGEAYILYPPTLSTDPVAGDKICAVIRAYINDSKIPYTALQEFYRELRNAYATLHVVTKYMIHVKNLALDMFRRRLNVDMDICIYNPQSQEPSSLSKYINEHVKGLILTLIIPLTGHRFEPELFYSSLPLPPPA